MTNVSHSDDYVIDVTDLKKNFGDKQAVISSSLKVKRGEIYGFLGPNGSGKTTTLRMICGLLKPDAGSGTCLGYNVLTQSDEIKANVGYMTQTFTLYGDLSIEQNLAFIARLYSMKNEKQAVRDSIAVLGLTNRRKQLARDLSGGWKQRLALSAALIHKPQLLLLDEPTAGVDPQARREFWEQVQLMSASGITTLVTTHYMDEAVRCNKISYIVYGRTVVSGTAESIIKDSKLITWNVIGADVEKILTSLKGQPGVEQVSAFGTSVHASGQDAHLLNQTVAKFKQQTDWQWQEIAPSLEDVFILFVEKNKDERIEA